MHDAAEAVTIEWGGKASEQQVGKEGGREGGREG